MVDYTIVALYLIGILALGLWSAKGVKTLEDFAVSHRSYTSLIIFMTLSASFIGGGFSTGNAEKVFRFGIANIVALWGFSLKEIFVGYFIATKISRFSGAISTGDIMRPYYGRVGQVVTGIFSILLCAGIVGAQVGAMGLVFDVFLNIGVLWGILIGCGIVITYSTLGGIRAVIVTDIIQFIILAIGIPLVLVIGVWQIGGIGALVAAVPADHFHIPQKGVGILAFVSLFLTFVLGETLVPPYVQRLLIGKDNTHTARGTILSGVFSIPFFAITGAVGLLALSLNPDINPNEAMPFAISTVLPIGLRGVVIAGVIAIVMSSADSFLNSASTSAINDVLNPCLSKRLSQKTELLFAKMINLIVGVSAIVFAITIPSVLDILIYAYNFWAPIILIPLAAVLLGFRGTLAGFIAGAIGGIVSTVIWNRVMQQPAGIDGLVIGTFVNFVCFSVANMIVGHSNTPAEKITKESSS